MKISLTEQQLKTIVTELFSQSYLDKILDKLSEVGYENLTDEEKMALNKISQDDGSKKDYINEPEEKDETDYEDLITKDDNFLETDRALSLLADVFPENHKIKVNNNTWTTHIETIPSLTILLSNDSSHEFGEEDEIIQILPFYNGDKMYFMYKGRRAPLQIKKMPTNIEQMEKFVDQFLTITLPSIINKLTTQH